MGRTDLTSVAKVAAGTCALALTVYYMLSAGYAETAEKKESPTTHLSEVKLDNLTLKMRFDRKEIKPGETPEVIVDIINTSDKKIERPINFQVMSIPAASLMARMPPSPREVWSKPVEVSIDPNQVKTLKFKPGYTLKDMESLSLSITAEGKRLSPELPVSIPLPFTALPQFIQVQAK